MRLLILISLCFAGETGSFECIHQVRARTVQPGGSITIPCSYSVAKEHAQNVEIVWIETNNRCSDDNNKIFAPSGNVTEKYKGRLHRKKDPNRNRTENITITELKSEDGLRFCCNLYNIKHKNVFKHNTHGTLLQFSDEAHVTQLDELIAVSGEDVVIPCYYSKDTSDLTAVIWGYSDSTDDLCTSNRIHIRNKAYKHDRYSVVNFSEDPSLRIHNTEVNDQRLYCCTVSTNMASTENQQRTKLLVADYQSSWDQITEEITVQEGHSVVLNCSHTIPKSRYTERNVLRVNVYWRVGNVTGPYAYHPYQEMVHSTYVHRTSITGMTNLMINNVTKADNTSFHCFVVVKLCVGNDEYEDTIMYGGGTRLTINDDKDGNFLLPIVIAAASVIILIILIGLLILLKKKGVICKKKPHLSEQQSVSIQVQGDGTCEEAPYCEINTKKPEDPPRDDEVVKKEVEGGQMEEGDDGILYAKVNKHKLKEKHPVELPMQKEEVVYAAVVNTTLN